MPPGEDVRPDRPARRNGHGGATVTRLRVPAPLDGIPVVDGPLRAVPPARVEAPVTVLFVGDAEGAATVRVAAATVSDDIPVLVVPPGRAIVAGVAPGVSVGVAFVDAARDEIAVSEVRTRWPTATVVAVVDGDPAACDGLLADAGATVTLGRREFGIDRAIALIDVAQRAQASGLARPSDDGGRVSTSVVARAVAAAEWTRERDHLERERRAAQEAAGQYRGIVEHFADAVIVEDWTGRIVFANAQFRAMFGLGDADLGSLRLADRIVPPWRDTVSALHAARMRGDDAPSRIEVQAVGPGGAQLWCEVTASVIRDRGMPTGVQSSIRDVTARVMSDRVMQTLNGDLVRARGVELHAGIARCLADVLRADLVFITRLRGAARATVETLALLVDGTFRTRPPHAITGSLEPHVAGGRVLRIRDGLWRDHADDPVLDVLQAEGAVVVPLIDPSGQPEGYVGIATRTPMHAMDAIEAVLRGAAVRLAADLERERTDTAFADLFVRGPIAMLLVDDGGTIHAANDRALAMFGYEAQGLTGTAWEALLSTEPGDLGSAAPSALPGFAGLGATESAHLDVWGRRRDGTQVPLAMTAWRVQMAGESVTAAVFRDQSDQAEAARHRERLEHQLQQSQKLESIGRLAGGIAHDFNNLLTVIGGYSEVLLADPRTSPQVAAPLKKVADAAGRAAALTAQLLAFSRQQVFEPRVVDLNVVVRREVELLRRLVDEDIDVATVLAPGLPSVRCDPGQIGQVLMNLVVNARDAMPAGGSVEVRTRLGIVSEADLAAHAHLEPGRYCVIEVADTGHGMTEEERARVFEPFFTTKDAGQGTGLGMAVVYGIVKQSGGHIAIESAPGAGTTVRVYLPPVEESVDAGREDRPAEAGAGGSEVVLLVEDNETVRTLAEDVLRERGYVVITASTGEEALTLYRASPVRVQLVVTDVVMPGFGGRALATQLRRTAPELPVLFMSGYTEDAIVRHGIMRADVAFIQKPFTGAALARKVREILDASAVEKEPAAAIW